MRVPYLRQTALHIAMATCQGVDIPKVLLASRRFTMNAVNAKDKSGHTALHIVARIQHSLGNGMGAKRAGWGGV